MHKDLKKIYINLNPQKKEAANLTLQNFSNYTPLIGLAAAVVLVIIILLQAVGLRKMYTARIYRNEWLEWEDRASLIKDVKSETALLNKEKESLQEVLTPKYEMVFLLEDIFSSLPKNIWFEGFVLDKDFLDLRGYVVRWQEDHLVSLDKFINSLRKKKYFSSVFSKVKIKNSQIDKVNGVEVLRFFIECRR
ncbi:MAG: hypothetical protein PHU64_03180 [Candidatus Omnitrophica bacterium]|nr:hypothetical protein [Candidatus Omnitrophota bacterium]MDD5429967.1 hypothetical protein [Candidatus Omnitrophota bacterium]